MGQSRAIPPAGLRYGGYPPSGLIAHRGGGDEAPENTLAGIRAAATAGFSGVEFDVMLSADGVPVLIHDETLSRTSNGCGLVCQTSMEQLSRLDAGSWFSAAFTGEPLPTLAQALALCRQLGLWANVEIKPASGYAQATGRAVAAVLADFAPATPALLLSSFSEVALLAAKAHTPALPCALLLESWPQDWQHRLQRVAAVAVHGPLAGLDQALVHAMHTAGYGVACYTVNHEQDFLRIASFGVDAAFTDRLAWGRLLPGALPDHS